MFNTTVIVLYEMLYELQMFDSTEIFVALFIGLLIVFLLFCSFLPRGTNNETTPDSSFTVHGRQKLATAASGSETRNATSNATDNLRRRPQWPIISGADDHNSHAARPTTPTAGVSETAAATGLNERHRTTFSPGLVGGCANSTAVSGFRSCAGSSACRQTSPIAVVSHANSSFPCTPPSNSSSLNRTNCQPRSVGKGTSTVSSGTTSHPDLVSTIGSVANVCSSVRNDVATSTSTSACNVKHAGLTSPPTGSKPDCTRILNTASCSVAKTTNKSTTHVTVGTATNNSVCSDPATSSSQLSTAVHGQSTRPTTSRSKRMQPIPSNSRSTKTTTAASSNMPSTSHVSSTTATVNVGSTFFQLAEVSTGSASPTLVKPTSSSAESSCRSLPSTSRPVSVYPMTQAKSVDSSYKMMCANSVETATSVEGMRLSENISSGADNLNGCKYNGNISNDLDAMKVVGDRLNKSKNKKDGAIHFPLSETFNFQLVCSFCFNPGTEKNIRDRESCLHCRQDVLVARKKIYADERWRWIRQRDRHPRFNGDYKLCTKQQSLETCYASCKYAHNEAERLLWTMEKNGCFSISEFISSGKTAEELNSVDQILKTYPGRLMLLCKMCYIQYDRLTSIRHTVQSDKCSEGHQWQDMLVFMEFIDGKPKQITKIHERHFTNKQAYYLPCKYGQFCSSRDTTCQHAHSTIERDIWYLQRDTDFTWQHIVDQAVEFSESAGNIPVGWSIVSGRQFRPPCPYSVVEACEKCWQQTKLVSVMSPATNCCLGHRASGKNLYIVTPDKKEVRQPPEDSRSRCMCRQIEKKGCCTYEKWKGIECKYAKNEIELKIWNWMTANKVKDIAELLKQTEPPVSGCSAAGIISPYYCSFCSTYYTSIAERNVHYLSNEHKENVNSDSERTWNHRAPPADVQQQQYQLVAYCRVAKTFAASEKHCKHAHSSDELEEWMERYQWREMKRKIDMEHLYPYIRSVLNEYKSAACPVSVVRENVDGVRINCSGDLFVRSTLIDKEFCWNFSIVTTQNELCQVALLHDISRMHFSLEVGCETFQEATGDKFRTRNRCVYEVSVKFAAGKFGLFSQKVVFDFGSRPVAGRTLNVLLCDTEDKLNKVTTLCQQLDCNSRWTPENCEIIPYCIQNDDELDKRLVSEIKYSRTDIRLIESLVRSRDYKLNGNNYKARMHSLLQLEEQTQANIVAKMSFELLMEVTDAILQDTYIYAQDGELFGRIKLAEQLNDDTDAGHLVIWSATSALLSPLAFLKQSTRRVYEARLVEEEKFQAKSRDCIYLRLTQRCCEELNLMSGVLSPVEVQFQMNRLPFCQMHFAVDQLNSTHLIFPDKLNDKWTVNCATFDGENLNADQLKILRYVFMQRSPMQPPVVVFGAFGTGKTHALATAAVQLAGNSESDARILICTHVNSSADEYIKRYFSGVSETSVIRVYAPTRRLKTVPAMVKKYCQIKNDQFVVPSREDVVKYKIVVTTMVTSLELVERQLKGSFTHIFVDESAQVLECEAIMPLCLADENTCVVLAGDHLQMSNKVYSAEARQMKFEKSIIERLDELLSSSCTAAVVRLRNNYRNHRDITDFMSTIFYNNQLVACSDDNSDSVSALNFYVAVATEQQDEKNTSYYNSTEAEIIAEQVNKLYDNWPQEWKQRDETQILVTTAYTQQVQLLRHELRKRHLNGVMVLRVHDLPGTEFRAVFISTVRSRQLLNKTQTQALSDFGFLSDEKLLNTALTRAKSFLAVVGDPEALCGFGTCKTVWRMYLKRCLLMNSLTPLQEAAAVRNILLMKTKVFHREPDGVIKRLSLREVGHCNCQQYSNTRSHSAADVDCFDTDLIFENDVDDETCQQTPVGVLNHEQKQILQKYELVDPNIYRHCVLHIQQTHLAYAVCIDDLSDKISISGRCNFGRAFDKDEVVVQLLDKPDADDEESASSEMCESTTVSCCKVGKVVRVLKRARDPRNIDFTCHFHESYEGILVPLSFRLPLIKIWKEKERTAVGKTEVCVYEMQSNKPCFKRTISVNRYSSRNMLFKVKFLNWGENYSLPVGVVVHVIHMDTIQSVVKNLEDQYGIQREFPILVQDEAKGVSETELVRDTCIDYKNKLVFTVDDSGTRRFDDALSIERLADGGFMIGVHIADVSHYVPVNSFCDRDAKTRGMALQYVDRKGVPMLHDNIATICSLVEGEDRRTLSVLIPVDKSYRIQKDDIKICHCLVRCQCNLTYANAESILQSRDNDGRWSVDLRSCVIDLELVARSWRCERVGDVFYVCNNVLDRNSLTARAMVEELMINANRIAASKLTERFREISPLRRQLRPMTISDEWMSSMMELAQNSKLFPAHILGEDAAGHSNGGIGSVQVSKAAWLDLLNYARGDPDLENLSRIVTNVLYQPQLARVTAALRRLQGEAEYVCSGNEKEDDWLHHSLNLPIYTHFTSPLRRYIDLVGHRMLDCVINNSQPQYTAEEIALICLECNGLTQNGKNLSQKVFSAHLSSLLDKRPLVTHAIIDKASEAEVKLLLPNLGSNLRSHDLKTASLKPSECPAKKDVKDKKMCFIEIKWRQRIYDIFPPNAGCSGTIEIDTRKEMIDINTQDWKLFVECVLSGDKQEITNVFSRMKHQFKDTRQGTENQTSEVSLKSGNHFREFSLLSFEAGTVKVQLSADPFRKFDRPCIQLFHLTHSFCICVEHNNNPVLCFAKPARKKAIADHYDDVQTYRNRWQPVLEMEASYGALVSGNTAIIHHVNIKWEKLSSKVSGSFEISAQFCKDRQIIFYTSNTQLTECVTTSIIGYMCVRYPNVYERIPATNVPFESMFDTEKSFTWVGHCVVTHVERNVERLVDCPQTRYQTTTSKDEDHSTYTVHLELNDHFCSVPQQILKPSSDAVTRRATIEWIPKTLPDRRMDVALHLLKQNELEHSLAENIALGNKPPEFDRVYAECVDWTLTHQSFNLCGMKPVNSEQRDAIKRSMLQSFTLIQGPPGTGKSDTIVRLASMLTDVNKMLPSSFQKEMARPQVMICGPSNKSVDVIAERLVKLTSNSLKDLSIVRVYSKTMEAKEFNIPGQVEYMRKSKKKMVDTHLPANLMSVALHHLVRQDAADNPQAAFIRAVDKNINKDSKKHEPHLLEADNDDIDEGLLSDTERLDEEEEEEDVSQLEWNKCYHDKELKQLILANAERYGKLVQLYDRPNSSVFSYELSKQYLAAIAEAEKVVLRKADIILCTCTASAASRIIKNTNIFQLIIDECAMSKEAESLIPIVSTCAKQVVLVGDHKQLQPVILEKTARQYGLGRSLFERYAKNAITLRIQYRMHQAIMEFPSQEFYDGKLEIGDKVRQAERPQPRLWQVAGADCDTAKPVLFVDVVGTEKTVTVATDDSAQQSKFNEEEAELALKVAEHLVSCCGIAATDITILSQYRAQCNQLRLQLENKDSHTQHLYGLNISTVAAAQGSEWEYVILSTVRSVPSTYVINNQMDNRWKYKHLGSITDQHQINVAITRPKQGLIIIGNRRLLQCDSMWNKLIKQYEKNQGVIGQQELLSFISHPDV